MEHTAPTTSPVPPIRLIPQLLEFAARQYGDSPFLLRSTPEGWRGFSFRQAAAAAAAFRSLLEAEGIGPGERVGLQSENRPEWGLAYLAILATGAVVVPLDAQLKALEAGEILATAGARFAVTSAKQLPVFRQVIEERVPGLRLISLDRAEGLPNFEDARERGAAPASAAWHGEPGDLAVLIFTSGTTGQAKGVMLSHSNILTNVEGVARTIKVRPGDRLLSVLPLHHTFEATIGLLTPLRVGATICYARGLDSKQLREDMATSDATIFVAVPLLYEKLLTAIHRGIEALPLPRKLFVLTLQFVTRWTRRLAGVRIGARLMRPVRAKAGLGSVRLFATGAAPLAEEVFWGFIDLGIPLVEGYGLTETSPVVCLNRPRLPKPGAVGWPLAGVEVRIDHADGEGNGEILVRGPNVMLGYYANPAATAEVMRDGWFCTGDLGRFLEDGRVRITGRLKNMIATAAGKKIYPEEIEAQLANSPYILEVIVAGGLDPKGEREEVHAHVYPNVPELELLASASSRSCDQAFIADTLRRDIDARCENLAAYKRVKRVVVRTQEFPKTTTGKIRRQAFLPVASTASRAGAVA